MERSAVISEDGVYRYSLTRFWGEAGDYNSMVFCMLNPSTADAEKDDPTIRRCIGFARREGKNKLIVVNTFALRTYDPKLLLTHLAPVGPFNKHHIQEACNEARVCDTGRIVCAWGNNCPPHRVKEVMGIFKSERCYPVCLGITKTGAPKHPLYVKADQPFIDFTVS